MFAILHRLPKIVKKINTIEFSGGTILIADTGYELYAACKTVKDLDQLYEELGMGGQVPDDAMHSVCDPKLPDAGEIWGGLLEAWTRRYDAHGISRQYRR